MKWPKTHFQEFPHCNPHWKQPRCGVTGWTNFSAIFLFLLSNIHNLATIGTVAGNSDNFLIFWIALMQWWSDSSTDRPMIILWPLPDHSPTALVIPDHRVRFKHLRICRYTWNIFLTELLRLQESLGGQNWSIFLLIHWQVHGYIQIGSKCSWLQCCPILNY